MSKKENMGAFYIIVSFFLKVLVWHVVAPGANIDFSNEKKSVAQGIMLAPK